MTPPNIVLKEQPPTAKALCELRASVGWTNPDLPIVQQSITSSLFWASMFQDNQLVACGRIIGDRAMYFYIQDVIVHPQFQRLGLGTQIMQSINRFITESCPAGSTVGLLAAKGKESFYLKHGFSVRDGDDLGLGMCRFI